MKYFFPSSQIHSDFSSSDIFSFFSMELNFTNESLLFGDFDSFMNKLDFFIHRDKSMLITALPFVPAVWSSLFLDSKFENLIQYENILANPDRNFFDLFDIDNLDELLVIYFEIQGNYTFKKLFEDRIFDLLDENSSLEEEFYYYRGVEGEYFIVEGNSFIYTQDNNLRFKNGFYNNNKKEYYESGGYFRFRKY